VWDDWFVQMVLEMLSHRTLPSCIPPVILTIDESLYDDQTVNAVRQLPSVRTVREWRSVLVVVTKHWLLTYSGEQTVTSSYLQMARVGDKQQYRMLSWVF
jgi:hypothetical protein